jgi:hypothetical protein
MALVTDGGRPWARYGLMAVVLIGIGWYAGERRNRRKERLDALAMTAQGWADVRACLLDGPLDPGEKPSARLLRQELSLDEVSARAWPHACADDLGKMAVGLDHFLYAMRDDAAGAQDAELVRHAVSDTDVRGDWLKNIDAIWDGMARLELPPATARTPPQPPPVGHPLSLSPIATDADQFHWPNVDLPARGVLRLDWPRAAPHGSMLCIFGPPAPVADALSHARCAETQSRGEFARPIPAPDDFLDFLDRDDKDLRRAPDVRSIAEVRGASVLPDGSVVALSYTTDSLLRVAPGASAPERVTKLPPLPAGSSYSLIGGHLFWFERRADGLVLFAREVPASAGAPLGVAVEIGPVPGDHRIDACDSGQGLVVIARSEVVSATDAGVSFPTKLAVVFATANGWTAPVLLDATLPHWFDSDSSPLPVRCAPGEMTLTWMAGSAVTQVRCTPDGCTTTSAVVQFAQSSVAVADLGGVVALARIAHFWSPITGSTGTANVRLRVAPLADLPRAPERLIVGDGRHGGIEGLDPDDIELYGRRSAAILVLFGGTNRYAVRIDATGAATPVQIER